MDKYYEYVTCVGALGTKALLLKSEIRVQARGRMQGRKFYELIDCREPNNSKRVYL